jgi:hypothetical protein
MVAAVESRLRMGRVEAPHRRRQTSVESSSQSQLPCGSLVTEHIPGVRVGGGCEKTQGKIVVVRW